MPRSASRSGRSTESPAAKPATRKSVRAVASPSPKAKSSPAPAAASRSRSTAKSPAASKSPATPAARSRSRTAAPAETKSTPAAKSRGRSKSAAKEPEAKKKVAEPATKSPVAKGAGAKSKKSTPSSAAKTKSAKSPAAKSRSSSAKKSAELSSPSPKKKANVSPKKASSKKAAETPKKSPTKKTPQRGRSSSRKGKQEEEEEEEEAEVEKAEDGEEDASKPEEGQETAEKSGVDETDSAAETAEKSDKKEDDEKPAAEEVAETKDVEMKTDEAETTAATSEAPDVNEKMEATAAELTSLDAASRKRKRDDEEENADVVVAKVQKVTDEVADKTTAPSDVPMEDGDSATKEATDAAAVDADDSDFIVISTDDVPAADSEEMQQVAAKMKEPTPPADVADGCIGANGCGEDPLLSRSFAANTAVVEPADASRCFTLASYNILADCHAANDYTGELAPWISDEQLAIPARHRRLMEELKYLDADIICLQEVGGDHMNDLLKPELETLGYSGVYIPRNTKQYTEGEATFYRTSRFSLVSSEPLILSNLIDAAVDESSGLEADKKELVKASLSTHAVAMLTRLKDVNSDKTVAVANIHVAYDKFERQDRQCLQLATAVQKLVQLAGGADKPHVICGDFNSWAGTPPYQLMSDGSLNDASLVALQSIESIDVGEDQCVPVVNLWADGFQLPVGGDLKSAYNTVTGAEPLTSRYARDCRVLPLDYIWFSSVSLDVLGVLKVVDPELITSGVPTTVFPSDHLSIKGRFAFK